MSANKYAAKVFQEKFPLGVTPLAQIIMLDAAHGDSNIVDICCKNLDLGGKYVKDSWQRYLIDTGPDHGAIIENLIRVIVSYKQPGIDAPWGNAPLDVDGQPKLSMVQFTHTDEDHSGGGQALLEKLAEDETLQRHFNKTRLAFHQIPELDPGFALKLHSTDPFKVSCRATNWADFETGLENGEYNIYLHYTFNIGSGQVIHSPSPTITIPSDKLPALGKGITVKCEVTIHSRKNVHQTNQMVMFNLRAGHKDIFKAIKSWTRRNDMGGYEETPGNPRYIQLKRNPKPGKEKMMADQPYHGIMEGRRDVDSTDIKRGINQKPPLLAVPITPTQGELFDHFLTKVQIVGPTNTVYNEFIGDCMRVEYDQGVVKTKKVLEKAEKKDGVLHNMASIVTLFRRWADEEKIKDLNSEPTLSMLFTGDAHDRECQVRNTVDGYAGPIAPRYVHVLKIPHHGSLCSTSVEFYNRITASVYLVCARQSNHGLPNLRILEAIVTHTARTDGSTVHIFFSNPDSLWNIGKTNPGVQSNLNILLSGKYKPGAPAKGGLGKYNYKCYILKHLVDDWAYWKHAKEKNAGIILLGRDSGQGLVVTADKKWWDIWDEDRINDHTMTSVATLQDYLRVKPKN